MASNGPTALFDGLTLEEVARKERFCLSEPRVFQNRERIDRMLSFSVVGCVFREISHRQRISNLKFKISDSQLS